MNLEFPGPLKLNGLTNINIVLGKNGCGKSSLLKSIDEAIVRRDGAGACKYITPERGGVLRYDPNVDNNITNNSNWLQATRRNNRFDQFRQQTMVLYRRLELLVLREIDLDRNKKERFSDTIGEINKLLENIQIEQREADFKIIPKSGGAEVNAESISSGEAELIGLAIECLTYARECKQKPHFGWLLLDEPDVHLHPDLQARFAALLTQLAKEQKMKILIATHSTALTAALAAEEETRLCFLRKGSSTLDFRPASECLKRVVPVFGAHPLSSIFNQYPLLLLEGEDDVRIWQRAVRVSRGGIKLYPVETGGNGELDKYEIETSEILQSVYDDPKAFSVRDRDTSPDEMLPAIGSVHRFMFHCRAAENLLLSDDVLEGLKCSWGQLVPRIEGWIHTNPKHVHFGYMLSFKEGGFIRMTHDLKEIRNDLLGIIGTTKSWEDAVGIAIGHLKLSSVPTEHSLQRYLGQDLCTSILN